MANDLHTIIGEVEARPGAKDRIAAYERAIDTAMSLAEARKLRRTTQTQLAAVMGITQTSVSQIEHSDNPYVNTLAGYVGALGGRLEINAVFDDDVIPLGIVAREGSPRRLDPARR